MRACDSDSSLDYEKQLLKGTAYSIRNSVKQIQIEILTNGPVEADFDVYEDFLTYKSGITFYPLFLALNIKISTYLQEYIST